MKGWINDKQRHSMASRGIKTKSKTIKNNIKSIDYDKLWSEMPQEYIDLMIDLTKETNKDGLERGFNISLKDGKYIMTGVCVGDNYGVKPVECEYPYAFLSFHTHPAELNRIIREDLSSDDVKYAMANSMKFVCLGSIATKNTGVVRCYKVNNEPSIDSVEFINAIKYNDLSIMDKHLTKILWNDSEIMQRFKDYDVILGRRR